MTNPHEPRPRGWWGRRLLGSAARSPSRMRWARAPREAGCWMTRPPPPPRRRAANSDASAWRHSSEAHGGGRGGGMRKGRRGATWRIRRRRRRGAAPWEEEGEAGQQVVRLQIVRSFCAGRGAGGFGWRRGPDGAGGNVGLGYFVLFLF